MTLRVLYLTSNLQRGGGIERTLSYALDTFERDEIVPHVACLNADAAGCGSEFAVLGATFHDLGARGRHRTAARLRLLRLLRREKIEVLHAFGRRPIREALGAARLTRHLKVVGHISTRHLQRVRPAKHERYLQRHGKRLNAVICASDALRGELSRNAGIPLARIQVVYDGRPLEAFRRDESGARAVRAELDIAPHAPLVLCVARLTAEKDHQTLLRAFSLALEKLPESHLVLVGEGSQRPEIEKHVDALNLGSRVTLCGYRPDVADFLSAADVFCLTSKREGLGGSIIEAQAAGIPCVVTDAGGPAEVILDGRTGFVASIGDVESIARYLVEILTDAERHASFGRAAREAASRFESRAMASRWLEIYRRVFANGAVPAESDSGSHA